MLLTDQPTLASKFMSTKLDDKPMLRSNARKSKTAIAKQVDWNATIPDGCHERPIVAKQPSVPLWMWAPI
jgi:hypothetical protein